MQFKSLRDKNFFYIDWWLTDHCNWNCSYCHEELKRSALPYPSLVDIKDFLYQANTHASNQNKRIHLNLTGGEVTEYPQLIDMLDYAKELDCFVSLRTNASKSVSEMKEVFNRIDHAQISYHPEHTQISHLLLCLYAAGSNPNLSVFLEINCLPDKWEEIENLRDKVKEKWPKFGMYLKMLFEDPIKNSKPLEYDKDKIEKIKDQYKDLEITTDTGVELTNYQSLILEKKNSFKHFNCNIGIEQIVVDAYHDVRRGHCRISKTLGSLGQEIDFAIDSVVCPKPFCSNAFDMKATKFK